MKVTCRANQSEQIKAGIDPVESITLDVNLTTLTPEQRTLIAEGWTPVVIAGTAEEFSCLAQAEVRHRQVTEQEKLAAAEQLRAAYFAALPGWSLEEHSEVELGIKYPQWRVPNLRDAAGKLLFGGSYYISDETILQAYIQREVELQAEADSRNAAALAAVKPTIEAAEAKAKTESEAAKAANQQAEQAKFAKRLETGVLEVELSRGNRSDWGEPWIAKVSTGNGRRPEYNFSEGSYDVVKEVLSIACKPGDVVAYGQKNYRKAKKTIHHILKMNSQGGMEQA